MTKAKKLIISIVVILLTVMLFFGILLFKVHIETKKMVPTETGEIVSNIYAIKDDFTNMYALKSGDKYIMIDAAVNPDVIKGELNKLSIDPEKVTGVFLTHSDGDHVGTVGLFKKADIYLPKEEEQMIDGSKYRFLFFKNKLNVKYKTLTDGQELEIAGYKIKCIHTPGHTPGIMAFLVNDKYLFTGDNLSLINDKVHHFNEFFNMDTEREKQSIDELRKLKGVEYIFTGHYGFSDNAAKAFE